MCLHGVLSSITFKYINSCPIEIIKGLTDKGQFQYLTGLKGLHEGTYLWWLVCTISFFRHFTWRNGVAKR